MNDDLNDRVTRLEVRQQELVKDVSEMKEHIGINRKDLYASIEKIKIGMSECMQQISSFVTSFVLLKWVVGIGLSLVAIALALIRML